jgi:hypothetical protein
MASIGRLVERIAIRAVVAAWLLLLGRLLRWISLSGIHCARARVLTAELAMEEEAAAEMGVRAMHEQDERAA